MRKGERSNVRGYLLDALEIWSMGKRDNDAAEVSVVKIG